MVNRSYRTTGVGLARANTSIEYLPPNLVMLLSSHLVCKLPSMADDAPSKGFGDVPPGLPASATARVWPSMP